jgi:hypothetical protein
MQVSDNAERDLNETYLFRLSHLPRKLPAHQDLCSGSYFRNQEPQKVGYTSRGKPVDVRYLFDRTTLAKIIRGIFDPYYA